MLSAETVDDLMRRFGKAFMRADREALEAVTTDDFEWHFASGPEAPDGRVYQGVDGVMKGIADNKQGFDGLRFEDIDYFPAGADKIVMTARVTGRHLDGDAFNLRCIELYTVRDGLIAKKDAFWKH